LVQVVLLVFITVIWLLVVLEAIQHLEHYLLPKQVVVVLALVVQVEVLLAMEAVIAPHKVEVQPMVAVQVEHEMAKLVLEVLVFTDSAEVVEAAEMLVQMAAEVIWKVLVLTQAQVAAVVVLVKVAVMVELAEVDTV
jgi:hypothetical protein